MEPNVNEPQQENVEKKIEVEQPNEELSHRPEIKPEQQKENKSEGKNGKAKRIALGCAAVLVMIGSIVGAFFIARMLFPPEQAVVENNTEQNPELMENATDVLFTAETLPRVDASLATQPLMNAFVENFTSKTTSELGIEYTNTHPAYVKLINDETDLIVVTEPSEDEQALAKEAGVELDVTKVVNEGFVFFVNKDNPVDSVSFEDLVKIYTGEITNWKELGGNDAEIIAYQRPENSGSQTGLYSLVLKGQPVKIPTVKESVELSMAGIVDYVANYENSLNAIGYGFYYYVHTMYYNENLKYLAVDGVKPTYETIQDGSYPILSAYYIVTRKGDANPNTELLKTAMLSRRGQYVASEAGYVPAN